MSLPRNTIEVSGSGTASSAPDTAVLRFTAQANADTAPEALERAAHAVRAIQKATAPEASVTVATSGASLRPDWRDGRESGYVAALSLTIRVGDLDRTGEVMTRTTESGGDSTRIDSLSFEHSQPQELHALARERAYASARAKAEHYASLSGVVLGQVLRISEGVTLSPEPVPRTMRTMAADAAPPVPIEAGALDVTVAVTVAWEISQTR